MHWSRLLPAGLLILTVLPATILVIPLALFGAPLWLAGVIDVFIGNYGFSDFLNETRQDMVLIFISAPIGLFSLAHLWKFLLLEIMGRSPKNKRRYLIALSLGIIAGAQLLFVQFGILFILTPATLYALYRLTRGNENNSSFSPTRIGA